MTAVAAVEDCWFLCLRLDLLFSPRPPPPPGSSANENENIMKY